MRKRRDGVQNSMCERGGGERKGEKESKRQRGLVKEGGRAR